MMSTQIDVVPEDDQQGLVEAPQASAVAPAQQQSTLSPMVQAVMDGKMTPETLAQLLEVQKDFEKNEAEKAFYQALAAFKTHEVRLEKDKQVSFTTQKGKTEYRHTTLGKALEVINPLLSQHGLSLAWETEQDMTGGGIITVTCVLSHSMGFSKTTSLSASPDASGGKNSIQAIASTVSYLERYTAFALVGLASMDQDDDGAGAGQQPAQTEYITDEQVLEIEAKIKDNELNMPKFLAWLKRSMKADSIRTIGKPAYQTVMRQIDASIKHKERAK
jgi:hypothetical protein